MMEVTSMAKRKSINKGFVTATTRELQDNPFDDSILTRCIQIYDYRMIFVYQDLASLKKKMLF
uniref:Uncharacterized protein n=1 Tax=Lepeophtheirus salmonis TaxID=72036 RepID=A0A0K2U722_LEPSM